MSDWKIEGRRILAELSEGELDTRIERNTVKVQRITRKIVDLKRDRDKIQIRIDKLNALKGELNQ